MKKLIQTLYGLLEMTRALDFLGPLALRLHLVPAYGHITCGKLFSLLSCRC